MGWVAGPSYSLNGDHDDLDGQHDYHRPKACREPSMSRIREVWAPNLEAEMRNIREMIDQYPFVAMVCVISPPHSIASRDPCNRIPNSPASSQDLLVASKRRQTTTTKPCVATSISSSSSKSALHSQTRKVTSLKTSRHGSSISSLASGMYYITSSSRVFSMCPFFSFLARTCTRQSRSNCCKSRESIFRDTRRWVSRQTISQSSLSPLGLSSFQKQDGYRFTGEVLATPRFLLQPWHDHHRLSRSSQSLIVPLFFFV